MPSLCIASTARGLSLKAAWSMPFTSSSKVNDVLFWIEGDVVGTFICVPGGEGLGLTVEVIGGPVPGHGSAIAAKAHRYMACSDGDPVVVDLDHEGTEVIHRQRSAVILDTRSVITVGDVDEVAVQGMQIFFSKLDVAISL